MPCLSEAPPGDVPDEFVIAIDLREKRPYRFPNAQAVTLPTADYSVVGLLDEVGVERKTKSDAYNSLGAHRRRFENELRRMADFRYAAIVVEASVEDFLVPPPFSRMNPTAAMRSLIAWSVKYGVPVFFAGSRAHGSAIVRNILEKYWTYRRAGVIGDG